MIYILLFLAAFSNSVMDAVDFNDSFKKYGKWFSKEGYTNKYALCEWLNKFLPLWLSKFLAFDVLVVFTSLWYVAKMIMVLSFLTCIFGLTLKMFLVYLCWGLLFSFDYSILK